MGKATRKSEVVNVSQQAEQPQHADHHVAPTDGTEKRSRKFPLTLHRTGQYCKKIRGKVYYFGKDKREALRQYHLHASALHAGRGKQPDPDTALTIKDLCNLYLDYQNKQLAGKQIRWAHFCDQKRYLAVFLAYIGPDTPVGDVITLTLQNFRSKLIDDGLAADTINNRLRAIRAVYNWARDNEILEKTPNLRAIKGMKVKSVERQTFTPEQIRAIIALAGAQMRAMILLGLNCGFGCTDCAEMRWDHLNLDERRVHYPRGKTEVERHLSLWPETVEALKAVPRRGELVFYTKYGNPWVQKDTPGKYPDRALSKEFKKLLRKAKTATEKGTGFYSLRRTAATIAAQTGDAFAVQGILAHTDLTMASKYVQRQKLTRQTEHAIEHTREWLGLNGATPEQSNPAPGE